MELDLPAAPRILIVRLSALGDVICAIPTLTALRRHRPEAHITWAVESSSAQVLQHHPDVDRVVVLPRRRLRDAWRRPWTLPGAGRDVWRQVRQYRGDRFDLVLDLQGNTKSGLFAALARGRNRVGHDRRFRKELLNGLFTRVKVHPLPEGEPTRWRVERDLGMLRALGIPAVYERRPLEIPPAVDERAAALAAGLGGPGPLVVLHPGTSAFGAFKRWDASRFSALGDRLRRARQARVLVSYGPGEEDLAARVAGGMKEPVALFPPRTPLVFLAAVYARADLVVGADSGPMQLAGLMGAPTLTLFGPKDPALHRPMGQRAEIVWMRVSCSPCQLRRCDHVACMRAMEVDDVAAPAVAMLRRVGCRSAGGS